MPQNKSQSISSFLQSARVAIFNALSNKQILSALSVYAYDETKLNEGKALFEEAEKLTKNQVREYGEQYQATADLEEAKAALNEVYSKSYKVARVAFKNTTNAKTVLGLDGSRKRAYDGWINQIGLFYSSLLESSEFQSGMAKFGYTMEKIEAESALVTDVIAKKRIQENEKGEAQDATKFRDEKLDELQDWMDDFIDIAKVALSDNSQLLESLGLFVRS